MPQTDKSRCALLIPSLLWILWVWLIIPPSQASTEPIQWFQLAGQTPAWNPRAYDAAVFAGGNFYVMGGSYPLYDFPRGLRNDVWVSSDAGKNWRMEAEKTAWTPRYGHSLVEFKGEIWLMGGLDTSGKTRNDVWHSRDGSAWVQAVPNAPWSGRMHHASVVFNNRIWILGGLYAENGNDVWWSENGIDWHLATSAAPWEERFGHAAVVFNKRLWVMGGQEFSGGPKNDVWHTVDGEHWQKATGAAAWQPRWLHSVLSHANKIWIMCGDGGRAVDPKDDVWHSADGTSWTLATAAATGKPRMNAAVFAHDGRIWLAGGFAMKGLTTPLCFNDVWSSADGTSWSQPTVSGIWPGRRPAASLVFNNKMWIIGDADSRKGDVWYSGDGAKWAEATSSTLWSPRSDYAVAGFGGKLWVTGGYTLKNNVRKDRNDVWRSYTGKVWQNAVGSAFWAPRSGHTMAVFNNSLWLMGGVNYSSSTLGYPAYLNDIWRSPNGVNWFKVTDTAPWQPRYGLKSLVFDNNLWIFGGIGAGGFRMPNYLSDVWRSSDGISWQLVAGTGPLSWIFYKPVANGSRMWILGSEYPFFEGLAHSANNAIWSSRDGAVWMKEAESSPWAPRVGNGSLIFNNKAWILGGISGYSQSPTSSCVNDVWYTPNLDNLDKVATSRAMSQWEMYR